MPESRLLHPIPEARQILGGISHTFFYELVRSGELRLTKLGSRSFVTHSELERLVDRRSQSNGGAAARDEATA